MAETPQTRYVESDGVTIAYQAIGERGLDILFLPGWISQIEQLWESAAITRFMQRLASFARLIMFDARGTGLSERVRDSYSLEQEARDAIAVLDATGSERAALFTYGQGGLLGVRLAAEHRERVGALVLYASIARSLWAPDYDWAPTEEQRNEIMAAAIDSWGEPDGQPMAMLAPSVGDDPTLAAWFARNQRLAASPREAREINEAITQRDVRAELPRVAVPTLVMHRPAERNWDVRHSRYLAEHIPGARYVEFEGVDSLPFLGDFEAMIDEVEEFLTGVRTGSEPQRDLLTVMFTDIVDATATAARLGDGRWRDLLAKHDETVRAELARYGGREVKTVGDGFLAVFSGTPSRALRCALALNAATRALDLQVRIGVHTGECELIGEDVGGMAVHIASRVAALADPGEVLVSGTVFGTVVGGPFLFEDRGLHQLKGVSAPWPLFALTR